MQRRVLFTEEERQEDIKDVEEMLLNKKNCHEIAKDLGRSVDYICDVRDYLIDEGIITKEKLEQLALERIEEKNKEFDEKVLNLIKGHKSRHQIQIALKTGNRKVNKSIERLAQVLDLSIYQTEEELVEQERTTKIKDYVNDGTGAKYIAQIAKATDIPSKTAERLVQKLINDGSIKEENIINKLDEKKELVRKRNEEICALNDKNVPIEDIAEKYHLTVNLVHRIIREQKQPSSKSGEKKEQIAKRNEEIYALNDNNVPITEIAEKFGLLPSSVRRIIRKREKQTPEKNDKTGLKEPDCSLSKREKSILRYLKKGIFYKYICKKEKIEQRELMKIITSLKERNYINQKIINEAREERKKYYIDIILKYLKEGLFPNEIYKIINKDEEEITSVCIFKYIKNLIAEGKITKEELEKWRSKRKKQELKKSYLKDEKLIWSYVENWGYDDEVIAKLMDVCSSHVHRRRMDYQKRHNISTEEYLLIRKQGELKRIEQEENEKRKLIESFYKVKALYQKEYRNSFPKLETKQAYFNLFREIADAGIYEFAKEDVDILNYIVLYEEELLTDDNVKYVMEKYLSLNLEDDAIRLLNNYINNEIKPKLGEKRPDVYFILQKIKQGIN